MSILQIPVSDHTCGQRERVADSPEARQWYAACTMSRHEKSAAVHVEGQELECFLPTYRSLRRWKDRRKQIELPLFPGYLFVRMALSDRLRVLQVPGVVQLVSIQGRPAALPEADIQALRDGLARTTGVQPHPYLIVGRPVRVRSGAFAGMEGILVRRKGQFRIVISINLIQRAFAIEVDEADVEPVRKAG